MVCEDSGLPIGLKPGVMTACGAHTASGHPVESPGRAFVADGDL